jgi:hypothetical protein
MNNNQPAPQDIVDNFVDASGSIQGKSNNSQNEEGLATLNQTQDVVDMLVDLESDQSQARSTATLTQQTITLETTSLHPTQEIVDMLVDLKSNESQIPPSVPPRDLLPESVSLHEGESMESPVNEAPTSISTSSPENTQLLTTQEIDPPIQTISQQSLSSPGEAADSFLKTILDSSSTKWF